MTPTACKWLCILFYIVSVLSTHTIATHLPFLLVYVTVHSYKCTCIGSYSINMYLRSLILQLSDDLCVTPFSLEYKSSLHGNMIPYAITYVFSNESSTRQFSNQ